MCISKTFDLKSSIMIFTHLRLLFSIIISICLYYADILSDIAVVANYYKANENGFFGISCFAILSSLLAQILYSPLLSIYRQNAQQISTPSCIFRLLLSSIYLTPIWILYKFLNLQCCRFAKGSRDELQLAKISDIDDNNNNYSNKLNLNNSNIDEQQKQDPNMIDTSFLDDGILTETQKCQLLTNMVDDMVRYSFVKSCFQSSINVFIQIFVLGEYYFFSDETRKSTKDAIALSENDILLFPDTRDEVYLLFLSTTISFICLCTASWSQISDLVKTSVISELNWCIPFLFRLRAIFESMLRVLRFMIVSVVFGAMYGIIMIAVEILWKWLVLSCHSKKRQARKRRKQRRKESGYSGGDGYAEMNNNWDGIKKKCECDWEVYKGIASWMLFSRERFQKTPCLMRFTDIILWTVVCLIATCVAIQFTPFGRLDTVCNQFLQFQVCMICLID